MKLCKKSWLHFTMKDCKESRNFAAENPEWLLTLLVFRCFFLRTEISQLLNIIFEIYNL